MNGEGFFRRRRSGQMKMFHRGQLVSCLLSVSLTRCHFLGLWGLAAVSQDAILEMGEKTPEDATKQQWTSSSSSWNHLASAIVFLQLFPIRVSTLLCRVPSTLCHQDRIDDEESIPIYSQFHILDGGIRRH